MSFKVDDGKIPRADLMTVIMEMEKMYPGRKVLLQLATRPINGFEHVVKCRVLDILTAPVVGHHNKKQDLLEVESVVEIPNPDKKEDCKDTSIPSYLLAPTGHIFRTHMGIADVIGMM